MHLLLAFLAATLAFPPQQSPLPTHPTSTPYSGDLSIFEDPARDQNLQVNRVMDTLGLRAGSSVADIGAGGGWFSVRAAKRVGATGHVFAEDINPTAVNAIRLRAIKESLLNIEPWLGTPDDPKLPANVLDAALMLRVYHEIAHPPLLLASLFASMKPGSRFAVVDHPGRGDDHGINPDVVIAEVQRSGFHFVKKYDFTKADQNDYLLLFEKPIAKR